MPQPQRGGNITLETSESRKDAEERMVRATGGQGAFRFEGLPEGQYTLCAQVPSSAYLNPCEWGLQPPVVSISRTQPSVSIVMVLKKGAAVPIRVDDPNQWLSRHEGSTPGAHLLLGVSSDNYVFHPASILSQDGTGRYYRVLIRSTRR